MSDALSVEEQAAAEQEVQDQGIDAMVKALSVGPVEEKKDEDKDKDKDEDKDKDKDEDKDDKDKDEDGSEDDEDKDKGNDEEDEDEDDEDKDKDEDTDKDVDKDEDKDEEDKDEDDEDKDEEDEDEKDEDEDEDEDVDSDLALQLEILKAENAALKASTKEDTKSEDQLGVTNIKDLEDVDFIGDEEGVEELASTKEGLNKLLNAVRSKTIQEMMVTLPNLAAGLVTQRMGLQEAVDKFYKDNEDFVQHKDYVSLIAQKVQSDHPGLKFETMFKLVEKTVRKNLNLKKKVDTIRGKENEKDGKKKKRTDKSDPALTKKGAGGGGSARDNKDTRTVEQKDIDSMLKTVG